jgi:hypothetical protein
MNHISSYSASPWDGTTYTAASDTIIAFATSDPHITPFVGKRYDILENGFYRYFDNNNTTNRFIINIEVKGKYIRRVYMKHNDKHIMIDMGWDNAPAKVLNNNGFTYDEKQLMFKKGYRKFCTACNFNTYDDSNVHFKLDAHAHRDVQRNEISLQINIPDDNEYVIALRNVNDKNVDHCRLGMSMKNRDNLTKYTGAIIKQNGEDNHINIDNLEEN